MPPRSHRQQLIRQLLAEHGRLTVDELARGLGVTSMTIRRDLGTMERSGVLTRTHGGCVLRSAFVPELPFEMKDRQHPVQKHAIAREAARRLNAGEKVYLDSGTTAVHLARLLPLAKQLHVFTNNLQVAMELFGRPDVEVSVFGGTLSDQSPELVGELALARIRDFRFDVAVLGADGVDAGRGEFYSASLRSAMLSQAAQQQAQRTIVMADSAKFGRHGLVVSGRLAAGTVLITDQQIDATDRGILEGIGAEVVYAATEGDNSDAFDALGTPDAPDAPATPAPEPQP